MNIARIGLLIGILCLWVLPAWAQIEEMSFQDIKIVPTDNRGLNGIGLSGKIHPKEDFSSSMIHRELTVRVYGAGDQLLYTSEKTRPGAAMKGFVLFPNTAAVEKRVEYWVGEDNIVFIPYARLGLKEGDHDISVELVITDIFDPGERVSERFPIHVDVPPTSRVFVRMWEKSRGSNWPDEGVWFFQGAEGKKVTDPSQPQGWINFVNGDYLQLGVLGEREGHTSGFRLFRIQITPGRSYTYQDIEMAMPWSLDTVLQNGYQKGEIVFPDPSGDVASIAGFEAYTWDYYLENLSPFKKGTEIKARLGNSEHPFARSSDSAFVVVPLDCGDEKAKGIYLKANLTIHGGGSNQSVSFYHTCGVPIYPETVVDDLELERLLALNRYKKEFDVATGHDGEQEFWVFSVAMKEMAKRLEYHNLPGDSLYLEVLLMEGGESSETAASLFTVQYDHQLWEDWKQIRNMRIVVWTAIGVGILLLIIGGIVYQTRKKRREKITDIHIG